MHLRAPVLPLVAALAVGVAGARGPLGFEERVDLAMRVEAVLDARRSAPENHGDRAPFEARVKRSEVARPVERDLMASDALATYWHAPITTVQLQAEIRRLVKRTQDPGLLKAMFLAVGDDPFLVSEVIARPSIARRELARRFPRDWTIHAAARERAERLRASLTPESFETVAGGATPTRFQLPGARRADGAIDVSAEELERLEERLPPCGQIGPVEETDDAFVIRRRLCGGAGGLSVETVRVGKRPVDDWLASLPRSRGWQTPGPADATCKLPAVTGGEASDFHDFGPGPMEKHMAVWSGSEMLVFGLEGGFRYSPATDTWRPMSTVNEPERRTQSLVAWTGTEMVIRGGLDEAGFTLLDSGALYDPTADSWRPMAGGPNAPSARGASSFVWTGTELLVFGGSGGGNIFGDGASYDPVTDTWRPIASSSPRTGHSSVWTGSEMLVWGGVDDNLQYLQTGARYDPTQDRWTPIALTAATPSPRASQHGVWTGSELLVWGGQGPGGYLDTGGRYDPAADAWKPMAVDTGTPSPRQLSTAVWSGSELIVWGGSTPALEDTGGRYDPATDTWRPTSIGPGVPAGRDGHTAVWTGSEMLIWGGRYIYPINTGGRYDPASDTWAAMSTGAWAPTDRQAHTAVWTGVEMIVFGGWDQINTEILGDGGRYTPATDSWEPTSFGLGSNAPSVRYGHTAVWTGTEMIVYGATPPGDGGRYDPATDAWQPIPVWTPPRIYHTAVWTGTEMIIWGGYWQSNAWKDGARFDPATSTWTQTRTDGTTPWPRSHHTAVWTGTRMIVWGGAFSGGRDDGGVYDPATDTWQATSLTGVPYPRYDHTAVWTGTRMIVWGGLYAGASDTGGLYDPATDTWTATSVTGAPPATSKHAAVWTGTEMAVWGGYSAPGILNSGGVYDPATDVWRTTTLVDAPLPAYDVRAVWTGREMVVTGYGDRCCHAAPWYYINGGRYAPATDSWNDGWGGEPPLGEDVLAGKPPGAGGGPYGAGIRGYRVDGHLTPTVLDAFPEHVGYGVRVAAADVNAAGDAEVLAAPGPGPSFPPEVRGFDAAGAPEAGLDFLAYGTGGFGANVAGGDIDGGDRILTGPGPSPVFGPHVRAFRYAGAAISPISKVTFYAYGTLRFGVNVTAGDLDGDGFEEIVTGAGPGAVFGPHVRGFDYDGATVRPLGKVSFFAYGTLRYGVEVGSGDVDGDGYAELLTGPGPSGAFAAQLRGFDCDGASVSAMTKVNAVVFPGARHGANVAAGDLDSDGYDEITCGAGPDPGFGTVMASLDYDGSVLQPIGALGVDVYGLSYGLRVACGSMGW